MRTSNRPRLIDHMFNPWVWSNSSGRAQSASHCHCHTRGNHPTLLECSMDICAPLCERRPSLGSVEVLLKYDWCLSVKRGKGSLSRSTKNSPGMGGFAMGTSDVVFTFPPAESLTGEPEAAPTRMANTNIVVRAIMMCHLHACVNNASMAAKGSGECACMHAVCRLGEDKSAEKYYGAMCGRARVQQMATHADKGFALIGDPPPPPCQEPTIVEESKERVWSLRHSQSFASATLYHDHKIHYCGCLRQNRTELLFLVSPAGTRRRCSLNQRTINSFERKKKESYTQTRIYVLTCISKYFTMTTPIPHPLLLLFK